MPVISASRVVFASWRLGVKFVPGEERKDTGDFEHRTFNIELPTSNEVSCRAADGVCRLVRCSMKDDGSHGGTKTRR
jgi:hypothetical protein